MFFISRYIRVLFALRKPEPAAKNTRTHASLVNLILRLLRTTEQTSSPGSNKTGLLTLCGVAGDGRGLTDMLVVTTTVRL